MKIAIIGATGMVGHVLYRELKNNNINVIGIGRRKIKDEVVQLDLYNDPEKLKLYLQNNKFDIIINCSAILVNESNINRLQAVYINSYFPNLLADLFKNTSTKIIHLSTGGVFSGNDDCYYEDSPLSPQTYYGITKAAGEFINDKDLVIRNDFWGPDIKKNGTGLFNWFLNQQGTVTGYTNVFFNGISNVEFSRILFDLIKFNGIIHIGTKNKYSKYDFLKKILSVFSLNNINILKDDNQSKNVYLKSKKDLPLINDLDTMMNDIHKYIKDNYHYYKDILNGNINW